MRYQNGFISIVTLVLALITVTGIAYTDQFPQAARAESVGFDALAHNLFDGSKVACADDKQQLAQANVR
ncbi:MAG: hypothetical protein V4508_18945 [Pseudomonadota bacterium]